MGRVVASRRGLTRCLAVLVAAVTLLVVAPTGAQASSSSEFVADINAARTSRGGHALAVKADLNAAALAQAQRMASKSTLYHNPNLGGSVSNWTMLAENVGYGPNAATIHAAFMASAAHRTNILNAKYTEVGVGVVVKDHVMWVAEVFRRPASAGSGSGSGSSAGSGSSGTTKKPSKAAPAASTPTKHPSSPPAKAHPPKAKPVAKPAAPAPVVPAAAIRADRATRQGPVVGLVRGGPTEATTPLSAAAPANPPTDGTDLPAPAAAALGVLAFVVLAAAARLRLT